jgi:hypothetical protein
MEKHQCCKRVYDGTRYSSFSPSLCKFNATIERDNKWYCARHDPEVIKAKQDKHYAEFMAKNKANGEMFVVKSIAFDACIKINPDNPKAVAESIVDMYEALKGILDLCNGYAPLDKDFLRGAIQSRLNKAEGKTP